MEFYWTAYLNDGSIMMEVHHRYGDIPRDRLSMFAIINKATGLSVLTLHLDLSRRLFYRRRTRINSRGESTVIHITGWTAANGNHVICAVLGNGRTEIASAFDEHHPYLYPIEFMPEENFTISNTPREMNDLGDLCSLNDKEGEGK